MPPMSRRHGSRPSAPNYDRRANSNRRDIRLSKRRRTVVPNWVIIAIIALIVIVGAVLIITLADK